ncbi:MAG TPA: signal peptidase I [Tepidisphaeraceae bacterium]|jgi:signal peptidase I
MTPHTRRKLIHYWRRQIRPILLLVLLFTSFRSTFADWNDVPTGSMKPTIFEGDRIFVNKLAYGLKFPYTTWHLAKWSGPQRGEIAVFYSPDDGIRLVKRVVGLPGDRIQYKNGFLTINGKALSYTPWDPPDNSSIPTDQQKNYDFYTEQLGDHAHIVALLKSPGRQVIRDFDEYTVPPDHYFMMGDNRDNSKDSRYFRGHYVERDQILGRANRIVFSLDYDDMWLPRKDRFLHALK